MPPLAAAASRDDDDDDDDGGDDDGCRPRDSVLCPVPSRRRDAVGKACKPAAI